MIVIKVTVVTKVVIMTPFSKCLNVCYYLLVLGTFPALLVYANILEEDQDLIRE